MDRVTASGNGYAGVHTQGNRPTRQIPNAGYTYDIVIKNSVVEDNQGDPYRTTSHSGNGILLENTSRSRIDGCLAQRNGALMGNAGDGGPVGIWAASSDGITIQHCVSRNNRSRNNQDGGGFDLDQGTTNCVLQYNYSFDNQGAGFLIYTNRGFNNSGHIVRYNISDNDALSGTTGGIAVSGQNADSNKQIRIYNNTVFGRYPTSRGIILKTTDRGAKFEDYSVMVLDNLVILQDPSRAWATSSPGGFLQGNQAIPLDHQDIQAGRLSIPPIGATRPISLANPDLMPYFRIQSPSVFMTIGLSNWYLPQRGSRDFFGVPFLDRRRAVGASHGITTPSSSG